MNGRKIKMVWLMLSFVVAFASCKGVAGKNEGKRSGLFDAENALEKVTHVDTRQPKTLIDLPLPLKGVSEQILYRHGYIASYNKDNKIPNWVAWHLTAAHTRGEAQRPGNAWHEDPDVPRPRATSADYRKSGWTRGHMCPAGDNKWDAEAMYDTFLLSNCCPQHSNLNTGTWNQIEMSCRRWAEKFGGLYIVCGPILFRQQHTTIGDNKVVVPEAFFKVIACLDGAHPQGIAFVCRNNDGNKKKDLYVNSIKEVERITGMTFFPHLPAKTAKAVKESAHLDDWE